MTNPVTLAPYSTPVLGLSMPVLGFSTTKIVALSCSIQAEAQHAYADLLHSRVGFLHGHSSENFFILGSMLVPGLSTALLASNTAKLVSSSNYF